MTDMPHGEIAIFVREEGFYPIQFMGNKPPEIEAADHAALNPGTLRIELLDGTVLWPEGPKQ